MTIQKVRVLPILNIIQALAPFIVVSFTYAFVHGATVFNTTTSAVTQLDKA